MRDTATEPVAGLPEALPHGETLLWQGAPRWTALAMRAFHVRKVALYFGVLIVWRAASAMADGDPWAAATATLWLALVALAALALLILFAWLSARTTVYTVTSRRVVIRSGIALPMSLNIPFGIIESAALRAYAGGNGDIALSLTGPNRVPYLMLWPHVRPWRLRRVEPMLRGVPDATHVATILASALAQASVASTGAAEDRDERSPEDFSTPAAAAA